MTGAFRVAGRRVEPSLNRITDSTGEETVQVEPRVMRLLVVLAARPGEVVPRRELLGRVWEGCHVTGESLTRGVADLRRIFGDDPREPRVVETIRSMGYRLVAPVEPVAGEGGLEPEQSTPEPAPVSRPGRRASRYALAAVAAGLMLASSAVWVLQSWQGKPRETGQHPWTPIRRTPLTTLPGTERAPVLSADGRQLAFIWRRSLGQEGIYVKNVDSETPIPLTDQPGPYAALAWSPDGSRLAFMRTLEGGRCGIFILIFPSHDERRLADCNVATPLALAWSPQGSRLLFADRDDDAQSYRLYALSLEEGEVQPLTEPPAGVIGDLNPRLSTDGRRVLFLRALAPGTLIESLASFFGQIWSLDLETGEETLLLETERELLGFDWDEAGGSLVLATTRSGVEFELLRIGLESGDQQSLVTSPTLLRNPSLSLTDSPQVVFEDWGAHTSIVRRPLAPGPGGDFDPAARPLIISTRWESEPRYSPDGASIVFISTRTGAPELWLSAADGSHPVRLTDFQGPFVGSPAWSPDGAHIAFESDRDGDFDLYVVPRTGGRPQRLTWGEWEERAPSWSADGRSLYYASNRDGSWQVWRVRAEGGTPERITSQGGYEAREQPRGGGVRLFYTLPGSPGIWSSGGPGSGEIELVVPELEALDGRSWEVVGARIFYLERLAEGTFLSAVDVESDTAERVALLESSRVVLPGISVSPDLEWVLYSRLDWVDADVLRLAGLPSGSP